MLLNKPKYKYTLAGRQSRSSICAIKSGPERSISRVPSVRRSWRGSSRLHSERLRPPGQLRGAMTSTRALANMRCPRPNLARECVPPRHVTAFPPTCLSVRAIHVRAYGAASGLKLSNVGHVQPAATVKRRARLGPASAPSTASAPSPHVGPLLLVPRTTFSYTRRARHVVVLAARPTSSSIPRCVHSARHACAQIVSALRRMH